MPDAVAVRIGDLVGDATRTLAEAGHVSAPRREAVRLVATLLGRSPAAVLVQREATVTSAEGVAVRAAVARRAKGEPLAHVTGVAGFRYLDLQSDARALIPRPETETLVDLVLERVTTGVAVDVGTGSGCLALSLATEGAFDLVLAIEQAGPAVELARENVQRLGAAVSLVRGDLVTMLAPGSVDALVSNPPYLTTEEYAVLDPSVRQWEPREALASGLDGLEATDRLLEAATLVLRPGGWLALEVDAARATEVARRAREGGLSDAVVRRDVFGRNRYVLAQRRA